MANLTLRALKAKHGDSLLLTADGATVLIDGGPSGVYNDVLRDALDALPPDGDEPPRINLMLVSHIDADHIDGILDLTAELLEAREDDADPLVRIERTWHNSFSDMIAQTGEAAPSAVSASAASVASTFREHYLHHLPCDASEMVLSSVAQGRRLRLDLKALNVDLNQRFKDRFALQGNADTPWTCGSLSMSVIGPTQAELDDLRKKWKSDLKKILKKEGAAAVAAAEGLDRSVSNLASIVAIAEAGGKRLLLTGDARGDMILDWLEATGHLAPDGKVHFDILKMPHHGSDRNVDPEFFERVTADHYLFCGNGGHGNPEPHTLEMLFEARPDLDYTIHMTYGPEELKQHSKFISEGNVARLDEVLSDPQRKEIIKEPAAGVDHLDIVV